MSLGSYALVVGVAALVVGVGAVALAPNSLAPVVTAVVAGAAFYLVARRRERIRG